MSPTRWAARVADTPAIELDGLVRRYGERTALDGVTVSVPDGSTLVVFGPNGAGKSTLLRVLATLLRPQGGTARVLGGELQRDGWKVRGRIGLLGHEPLLHRDLTARENLRFHARLHGVAFERIDELLEQVGLQLRSDEPIRELSRGMVQRVAACRAVLHEPDVLLLDEPTANLDPDSRAAVRSVLARHHGTVLMATNDPDDLALADQVWTLEDGRVQQTQSGEDYRDRMWLESQKGATWTRLVSR
jgi:heme ABC exporter ATP-binding subunit CcmA